MVGGGGGSWLAYPSRWPRREQLVLNHPAWEGRISRLPWQQPGASLSVWPLTAAAPDWLRRPAPPLLRGSLTLQQVLHPSLKQMVQRRCMAGGPHTLCGLRAPTCGWVTLEGFHQHHWPGSGAIHSRAGCRENKAQL